MAIPQGKLSTTNVEGTYYPPIDIKKHPTTAVERGPIAIEDTTEGLLYQNWTLLWDAGTGMFSLVPETVGVAVDLFIIPGVVFSSFTFDQAGRVSLTYVNGTSSYLFWYDTALGYTVHQDLGVDALYPVIYLDDKRETMSSVNDMLLWYTKAEGGGTYELFSLRQRDRFLSEISMTTGLPAQYITALGMTDKFRIEIKLRSKI